MNTVSKTHVPHTTLFTLEISVRLFLKVVLNKEADVTSMSLKFLVTISPGPNSTKSKKQMLGASFRKMFRA